MSPRSKNNAIDVWLKKEIDSGKHKGLKWIGKKKQIFSIPWVHASRRQWRIECDASLYKSWAMYKNRYKEGTEAAVRRWSKKLVFLRISQNSQENTCAEFSFLIRLQALRPATLLKRDSNTGVFLWIFPNF